jgi:predicted nucleic acid-binding protein
MGYLLDTNSIICYLEDSLPFNGMNLLNTIVDDEPLLSSITKIETLGYNFKSVEEQITMETFINGSTVLEINNDIVNKTIELRKIKKIKLPDAIIAATALVHNLTLITRNTSDFKNIVDLIVIDPHKIN